MKRILCILLAIVISCSVFLVACDGCSEKPKYEEQTITRTDIVLFDGKKSEYKIVIPEKASEYETFAAEELVLFFEEATGVELEVIADTGLTHSEENKYFSIGQTSLLSGTDILISYEELGNDGYKLIRKGKSLYFCGGSGFGTVYAVYGFLKEAVGYTPLAPDEIIINKAYRLNMPDFNVTDIPAIAYRTGGHYVTNEGNKLFAMRSRTYAGHGLSMFQEDIWGTWSHTHFPLLPKATYEEAHPDWYSTDGTQLCLSNSEMRTEMVESIKRAILADSTSELYMIGQEDSNSFCICDACQANKDALGGRESALMMEFINDIAMRIDAWAKVEIPHRRILIGTFAYQMTEAPPVEDNDKDGVYQIIPVPSVLKDSVRGADGRITDRTTPVTSLKANDNVFVMIAPIYADWSTPLNDVTHNANAKTALEGWSVASDKLALWTYCNNFNMTLEYFDNVNMIATNYGIYEDMNAFYIYDESGQSVKGGMMFQIMMGYLNSELMWDNDLNVDQLIDTFMNGYYKEAAVPMRKLFDLMRTYFTTRKRQLSIEKNTHYGTGIWRADANKAELSKDFWNIGVLEQMISYIDEAYEAIDNAVYDAQDRETMKLRIMQESLTPRMYLLQLFAPQIETNTYLKMIEEFEADMSALGMSYIFSGKTLTETTNQWRNNKL